uniref:C2H2-type domain-containing protein n=1 Tax=Wuchereria bancrofti TaxID=6293 RepID=A0AAF5PVC6_WUCBA
MLAANEEGPAMPGIFDVLRYLENEPVMLYALQEFMNITQQRESLLLARLTEAEGRLAGYEGRNAQQEVRNEEEEEMEEGPAPQEPEFNIEEAEWAPLPESDDEAEWLTEAELAPLPDSEDSEENPEVSVAPEEASGQVEEPEEEIREIVLRTRTIKVPVPATNTTLAAAIPEAFRPADLEELPEQLRRELEMPQAEPYMVVRVEGTVNIVCGICNRQFETLKGWRIHASRMHKQDGFCARCGHYLLLPPDFTAAQKGAAMELHALDWCPRACAAVMKERQVKRRRLNLVGREEDTHHLFVPVNRCFRPIRSSGTPHAVDLSLPVSTISPLLHPARPVKRVILSLFFSYSIIFFFALTKFHPNLLKLPFFVFIFFCSLISSKTFFCNFIF